MEAYEDALDRQRRSDSTDKVSNVGSVHEVSKAEASWNAPPPVRKLSTGPKWSSGSRRRKRRDPWYKRPMLVWICVVLILFGLGLTALLLWLKSRHGHEKSPPSATGSAPASASAKSASLAFPTAAPPPSQTPTAPKPFYGVACALAISKKFEEAKRPTDEPPELFDNCGFTRDSVTRDLQLMSTITTRIRVYSNMCNQSQMMLDIISSNNIPLKVAQGVDMVTSSAQTKYFLNTTWFQSEMQSALLVAKLYPDLITAFVVGNEVLMEYASMNMPIPETQVVQLIKEFRQQLQALNLPNPPQIASSEAPTGLVTTNGPSTDYVDAVDIVFANIHPWWGGSTGATAFQSLSTQWTNMLAEFPDSASKFILGETGWPATLPNQTTFYENTGAKAPSTIDGLQEYLNGMICNWNQANRPYYWFQGIDEPGKAPEDGPNGVENHWGLFDTFRVLKPGLTLPTCNAP